MALAGRFSDHHALMCKLHLRHVDELTELIDTVDKQIELMLVPFRAERELLMTIPGIGPAASAVIISESGSPGALPHRGPLRTVRAPRRCTRLKQAPRALRAGVLASCVCGPEARGGRRRVSSGFGYCPACRACPGGRGIRRRSPCGPRSATTAPTPAGIGAGQR